MPTLRSGGNLSVAPLPLSPPCAEAAYLQILQSSQTLLTVLKRESVGMQKRSGRAT